MKELTHAEMQGEHYQALRENPGYAFEGLMDCYREEFLENQPLRDTSREEIEELRQAVADLTSLITLPRTVTSQYTRKVDKQSKYVYK